MKIFKFILSFVLLFGLVYLLNQSFLVGEGKDQSALPPLGRFLAPHTGFWQNAEGQKPNLPQHLVAKNLSAPVEIVYDKRLVPHIFAQTTSDAYFAQGYVTAALRLWQMEFQTHAAAGRLTEILGSTSTRREALLKFDRKKRRSGLPWAAKRAAEEWKKDPNTYALLESYTAGVNAYIQSLSYDQYPLEYKLLNYKPEPWTVEKTSLLLKSMAETLTGQDDDFALTQLYALLGKEKFQVLYPSYFAEQSPIILDTTRIEPILPIQDQEPMSPFFGPGKDSSLGYQGPQPFPTEKGIGSNNWAVAPSKTANKKAILCNDPHLKLNLPSIWFEVQLVTPSFNAYGASLPGAPGIISGFNEHVAWGVTNVSHDVRDWYQIQWKDASKKEYLFDGSYRKADHRYDTIRVRGQAPFVDTIIFTHWGPIAHSEKGNDYALRWSAHDPSNEALTFVLLNQAKNYQDYQKAISHFACPAQNIVFAAKDGDIALWTQGKLPLRRPQQGKFVQDGSKSSNAWQGFIPQEHIPHEHNPKKGFVGSANQHSINPQLYPYPYYGYFEEYRGRYLNQKLASMSNISIEDMKKLQNDDYSYKGKDFLPLLMKYLQRAQLEKDHLEILALVDKWDYLYDKKTQAPTIFEHWYNELEMALYDELMQPNDTGGLVPLRPFPYEWTTLNLLKRDTLNPIWDVKVTPDTLENIRHIVTLAFKNACKTLLDNPQKAVKKWGQEKASSVQHLAQINPFGFFNLDNGGHGSALNAMTSRNGPSWRMIVELGEVPKGLGVYPGGQSGNPGSPFYSNLLAAWTAGEYFDLLFWKKPEEAKDQALFYQYIKK